MRYYKTKLIGFSNIKILYIVISILSATLFVGCDEDKKQELPTKTDVIEKLKRNTFTVKGADGSIGTGFKLKNGWVATNYHVIEGNLLGGKFVKYNAVLESNLYECSQIWLEPISIPSLQVKIQRAYYSKSLDLAILQPNMNFTNEMEGLSLNKYSQSTDIYLEPMGADVYLFGNPLGLTGTFSEGVISAHRKVDNLTYLQFTSPASMGNSGGPLTDQLGNVVGIAKMQAVQGQNLNIAVPATYLYWLCMSNENSKLIIQNKKEQTGKGFDKMIKMALEIVKLLFIWVLILLALAGTFMFPLSYFEFKEYRYGELISTVLVFSGIASSLYLFHLNIYDNFELAWASMKIGCLGGIVSFLTLYFTEIIDDDYQFPFVWIVYSILFFAAYISFAEFDFLDFILHL